ncbi:KASH5 protein, partial [Xiphorhynchus elegans]|nr:KASH5 protein [Xiphorhynchus elegans]
VTGHSGHEGRLRALRRALDPAASGAELDLPRFRTAMGAWIAACRQDGSPPRSRVTAMTWTSPARKCRPQGHPGPGRAVGLGSPQPRSTPRSAGLPGSAEAAGLRSRARQLAAHNTKLQRDAELAEELNARLAEETAQLQAQLRSSRQALEQARAAAEELEDLKATAKGLEEENGELRRQARHMNQRLLAEGRGLREQIQAQAARMADLEAQLCRGTALLSARDAALAQAGRRAQELTVALEEYDRAVQELRLETTQLRQQLGRMRDAWAMYAGPGGTRGREWDTGGGQPGSKEEEEEERTGTAVSGAPSGSTEGPCQPPAPRAAPWAPWALTLLALLALLYLLPPRWPQPQLRYRRPPPL